ncbi:hypothetical protein Mapa_005259 [Marchantia paleacea]|nr:hypothetical protein Mapa_005259 [Marchantia paleacea]
MWHSGRFCGKQVAVSCIGSGIPHAETQPCFKTSRLGGPVLTATVVEHATGNNLLLSELAFAKLAPIDSVLLSVNVTFLGITK